MILQHLTLENFHCFEKADFDFSKQTTVFIGKNGTGKSSLLKAVCNALSFIFNKSNNSAWGFSSLANEVTDLGVENINVREIFHNGKIADYVSIQAQAQMIALPGEDSADKEGNLDISWNLRKNSYEKATLQSSLYKDAYIKFRHRHNDTGKLPLLVYYSDRYPHVNTNLGSNVKSLLNEDNAISRTWGYYHWNEFSSCAEIWQKRFIRMSNQLLSNERILRENTDPSVQVSLSKRQQEILDEIQYVTNYLKVFSDNSIAGLSDRKGDFKISAVTIDGATDFDIKFIFTDGVERRWYELPAGLERLFSIVFDMAYRSYILNRGKSEPEGIVIIDELDLHLHPSLQQDVLLRLQSTFPKVQFIIATHSPLIVTNLRQDENNKVVEMLRTGNSYSHTYTGNLFIYDYAYTLSEVMHTAPRNFVLESLKERYIRLCHRDKKDEAKKVLSALTKLVGENSILELKQQLDAELAKG